MWLQDRRGQPVLLLIAPTVAPGSLVATAYFATDRLMRTKHLFLEGTQYRASSTIREGFHCGPIERAAGVAGAPNVELTLREVT